MSGKLFVVATPIGNLGDLSPRAQETLASVDLILCEDTRVTRKILTRFGFQTSLLSFHEHNEKERVAAVLDKLGRGEQIALVSDAGTPGVSDPGYRLISTARARDITVAAVPGPSAVLAAIAISGLPTSSFTFVGFLPSRGTARRKALDSLAGESHTLVLFESARRLPRLLEELSNRLGARQAFVAREMTKRFEEHRSGTLAELACWASESALRGEVTLVVSGNTSSLVEPADTKDSILLHFQELVREGSTRRNAVKRIAKENKLPARTVYRYVLDGMDDETCI